MKWKVSIGVARKRNWADLRYVKTFIVRADSKQVRTK